MGAAFVEKRDPQWSGQVLEGGEEAPLTINRLASGDYDRQVETERARTPRVN